jgi:hypothetical protein
LPFCLDKGIGKFKGKGDADNGGKTAVSRLNKDNISKENNKSQTQNSAKKKLQDIITY